MDKKKRIWMALVIIWMVVIFSFSATPSDRSSEESLFVGRMVGQIFVKDFKEWDMKKQEAFAEKIEYPVRKCAHATEYAVLGILLIQRLRYQKGWNRRRKVLTAWGIAVIYAATDEIHQIFVPGRACMVTDVMIDAAGAAAGIIAALILEYLLKYILNRKKEEKNRWK